MHPLPMHPFSQIAAQAALAAQEQGKFLEMHKLIFERSPTFQNLATAKAAALGLPPEKRTSVEVQEAMFTDFAVELGLDVTRFKTAMESDAVKQRIQAETREVTAVGANGTPASFINGRYLRGAQPYEAFKALVDQLLVAAAKPARGDAGK
jgi:predicted DsbA family dithiol-disulfide isomerase